MESLVERANNDELEIEATEEPEEQEEDLLRYQISYYPSDMTLQVYHEKWKSEQLQIPDFQRDYVWDIIQASKLIESFLIGIPVPGVFLYKEHKTNKLLVIDGQQRILSVMKYLEGVFGDRIFRLKNVQKIWEGKTYKELSKEDQYQIQDAILRATVVQQLEPNDTSSIYHIFERLNTGGLKLSPMEIRKCVYTGSFFRLLESLNKNPNWLRILARSSPDKRLKDVELLLRFMALKDRWKEYEKPMKSFLNKYMSDNRYISEEESIKISNDFARTCELVIAIRGEKPFHLRGRLNLALMDSFMSAVSYSSDISISLLKERSNNLLSNEKYIEYITKNTSDVSVIQERFKLSVNMLLQ